MTNLEIAVAVCFGINLGLFVSIVLLCKYVAWLHGRLARQGQMIVKIMQVMLGADIEEQQEDADDGRDSTPDQSADTADGSGPASDSAADAAGPAP